MDPARGTIAFVAAHPDDEVVGAAAQLARQPPPLVVHLTDGAPRDMSDARALGISSREEYALTRRGEALAALALAGVPPERVMALDAVDQEASLAMAALARRLAHVLRALGPSVVFSHPYEGGHPDHDAAALVVHAAVALLARAGDAPPALYEFTSYHATPGGGVGVGVFLSPNQAATAHGPATGDVTLELDEARRALKARMLGCFRTQWRVLSMFGTEAERYRRAPGYRFTVAPHPGRLHYEQHPWGMTGARWRALAGAALRELGLPDAAPL